MLPSARVIPTSADTIVVVGSINIDLVTRVARLPEPGETVPGESFHTLPGGKGANQAVAAARLGAGVHMVGRVGDDAYGRQLRAGLGADGVGVRHVRVARGVPTGCAAILVDRRGENCIAVTPGANALVTPADVDAAESLIRRAGLVVMQLEVPIETILHTVALCRRLGVTTILDPAPIPREKFPAGLFGVDLLTPNETEAAGLMARRAQGRDVDVAKALLARGPQRVVLKLGRRGAFVAAAGATRGSRIPAFDVDVIDTTAAGDAFTGALAVALCEGRPLSDAARFANAAGALCCSKLGAQPAMPTRRAVDALLRRSGGRAG